MDLTAAALAAISIAALAFHFLQRSARRAAVMAATGLRRDEVSTGGVRSRSSPAYRSCVSRLGNMVSPRPDAKLSDLLESSGTAWTLQYLQGLRLLAALAFAFLVLSLGPAGLLLTPLLFAAGYRAPLIFLGRKRRRRWERIAADLPEVVDLMAVLCFAGESLLQALRHSIGACSHPFSRQEMENILEPIRLGESAAASLHRAADHPCPEMRRFSRTLLRAEEFGAPVADTLEELAVELSNGRREKERVRASRVSVLILLPLVFLILPSFLLLTVGGMILGYTL
ncbi:MAG: type II secretion system F family protein [Actinobacteria bacterium]|nr:type II secretion system F family protein [Actinomycetota bacterium]